MTSQRVGDGCTGIQWLDFFYGGSFPWQHCCEEHDIAYGESDSRREADWVFRQCVRASGHPVAAWVMWLALRAFGWYAWNKETKEYRNGEAENKKDA